ncbi:MAG: HD domain-containing protein [Deltaproteobacteria bacterium]|jgi:HD superfamily phosphodiesterase|nr:HD domain-containing protein [Deltaproteobacteria bacterium]
MDGRKTELLKKIGEQAVQQFWQEAFGGKSYGSQHLYRVNRIARYLWEREGGDEFLILATAWVHDVFLAKGDDSDSAKVAAFTMGFLREFDALSEDEIRMIARCAGAHEAGGEDLTLEARIVHDADVLDKSGMLGVVRHIWKMTHMLKRRVLTRRNDLNELRDHLKEREGKLFAKTAIILGKTLNEPRELFFRDKEFAIKTMTWISNLGQQGVICENVAKMLVNKSSHPSLVFLKNQLSCGFLSSLQP